jgi:hypothetical protein
MVRGKSQTRRNVHRIRLRRLGWRRARQSRVSMSHRNHGCTGPAGWGGGGGGGGATLPPRTYYSRFGCLLYQANVTGNRASSRRAMPFATPEGHIASHAQSRRRWPTRSVPPVATLKRSSGRVPDLPRPKTPKSKRRTTDARAARGVAARPLIRDQFVADCKLGEHCGRQLWLATSEGEDRAGDVGS